MLLTEITLNLNDLTHYAKRVVVNSHGRVQEVFLVGSGTASQDPNDIDLLYVLNVDVTDLSTPAAEQTIVFVIEQSSEIDLDSYDSFFQAGSRFFYVVAGAGRDVIENTAYANEQIDKRKIKLA